MLSAIDRSAPAVQMQINEALALARLAAAAYRGCMLGAASLQAAAERAYVLALAEICNLTDEEADLLEPVDGLGRKCEDAGHSQLYRFLDQVG